MKFMDKVMFRWMPLTSHIYLNGENGNVKCCLQKKSVETLRSVGAVNNSDCVDIDTGALIMKMPELLRTDIP